MIFTPRKISKLLATLYVALISLFMGQKAVAQVKINADSLFLVARDYSFEGKYTKALQITDLILKQNPDYYDVALLKCRINAWQGYYADAEKIAMEVLGKDPKNYDAYDALSSIYLWNNQNEECILTINRALYFFEDDINLLSKKTKALLHLQNYDDALEIADTLLELDPENTSIKKLYERVIMESKIQGSVNIDSLFIAARDEAIKENYSVSRQKSKEILAISPKYNDAQILIARTYAWEKKYEIAQKELATVLAEDPENYDAINLQIDIYFWDKKYTVCLSSLDKALESYPKDIPLLVKKFKVQMTLHDNTGANETLKIIKSIDPQNKSIKEEKKKIGLSNPYKNIIRVEYNYETFKEPWKRMWNMTGLAYGRHTEKYGDYYANIYMGDLILPGETFGTDLGYQLELECYPKIDDNNTFFFAYAYSPSPIFATHRLGVEYYRSFLKIIDASLGYRYMNFSNDVEEVVNVNVFTASVAKYLGNYWLSFRPYLVKVSNVENLNSTYQIICRRYLARPESFVGLTLGYGISSPDDNFFQNNAGSVPLYQTFTAQAQFKYRLTSYLSLDSYLGYENAEYEPNLHRGQVNFRAAISCLF
ncbi:MAG: YaiO family outer membrane beta-barrel protein [Mangrovibacterium sp.]